jgi:hypothetical protein
MTSAIIAIQWCNVNQIMTKIESLLRDLTKSPLFFDRVYFSIGHLDLSIDRVQLASTDALNSRVAATNIHSRYEPQPLPEHSIVFLKKLQSTPTNHSSLLRDLTKSPDFFH